MVVLVLGEIGCSSDEGTTSANRACDAQVLWRLTLDEAPESLMVYACVDELCVEENIQVEYGDRTSESSDLSGNTAEMTAPVATPDGCQLALRRSELQGEWWGVVKAGCANGMLEDNQLHDVSVYFSMLANHRLVSAPDGKTATIAITSMDDVELVAHETVLSVEPSECWYAEVEVPPSQ
jgi:hypothetical protein